MSITGAVHAPHLDETKTATVMQRRAIRGNPATPTDDSMVLVQAAQGVLPPRHHRKPVVSCTVTDGPAAPRRRSGSERVSGDDVGKVLRLLARQPDQHGRERNLPARSQCVWKRHRTSSDRDIVKANRSSGQIEKVFYIKTAAERTGSRETMYHLAIRGAKRVAALIASQLASKACRKSRADELFLLSRTRSNIAISASRCCNR